MTEPLAPPTLGTFPSSRLPRLKAARERKASGRGFLVRVGLCLSMGALLFGCSGGERAGFQATGGSSRGFADANSGPCESGEVADCSVYHELSHGVPTCMAGTQTCVDGKWSSCERKDPKRLSGQKDGLLPKFASARPGMKFAAISTTEGCADNSCDPNCVEFNEPRTPITSTASGGAPDTADIPDWSDAGGPTSCAHAVCNAGVALDPSCHPCVQAVCDIDASCCTDTGSGTDWSASCASLALSTCPASPVPTSGSDSCAGVPNWTAPGGGYTAGSRVRRSGKQYECKPWPYDAYCNMAAYDPAGIYGSDAWVLLGDCVTTAGCAINLDTPAAPPYNDEPCYSGLNCQINHRCEDVATDASCARSKCVEGAALDASCDPCVSRICADHPECCAEDGSASTEEWDATCVSYVKTICDADCGPTGADPCDHQLCDVGVALDPTCHSCTATVCSTPGFGYCCDESSGSWDEACTIAAARFCSDPQDAGIDTGNNRCDYALMGSGALAIFGANVLGGDVGGGTGANAVLYTETSRPVLTGNIYSQGSLDLYASDVAGDVIAAGALDPTRCTNDVKGACLPATSPPSATIPARSINSAPGSYPISSATTLAHGSYGDVTVAAGQKLTLQAGPYTFNSLTVEDGGIIELPATGTVYLDVGGPITYGKNVQFQGVTGPSDALRFIVYAEGNILIDENSVVYGMYTAPLSNGRLERGTSSTQRTRLYGLMHVTTATLQPFSEIDATGLSAMDCAVARPDVSPTCPVTVGSRPEPPGTGQCIENAPTYVDAECSGADLALDFSCADSITVCNHGMTDAPAGATLAFYERSGNQFATDTPDNNWLRGTCTVSSPVPSGGCVEEPACDSLLTAEDAFVMINEDEGVNECSRLDNWTYHVSGQSCGFSASYVQSIHRYEATCPENMVPYWSQLTWDTTTPGASTVTFDLRTAVAEAEFTGVPWTEVALAEQGSIDTQLCDTSMTESWCPVDIGAALSIVGTHPSFLELRMLLAPTGSDAPTVNDWGLSYTCVFDQ